jgi:hypothetical protein
VRTFGGVSALLVVTLAVIAGTPAVSHADATVGNALITRAGTLTPLTSGGSTTDFGVALPTGEACPGDSAHDDYLVYSFLVPKGVSPTSINFKTGVPDRYYGFIAAGSYFGAVNTAQQTGQVVGIPSELTLSRWTPAELLKGADRAVWDAGIACANAAGQVTNYWVTQFTFHATPSDPGGYTWQVAVAPTASGGLGLWLGGTLLIVALATGVLLLVMRRRRDRAASGRSDVDGRVLQTARRR